MFVCCCLGLQISLLQISLLQINLPQISLLQISLPQINLPPINLPQIILHRPLYHCESVWQRPIPFPGGRCGGLCHEALAARRVRVRNK